eukprot:TRINITY_DN915_c0_g6_i1.p1 TRINITY_DN915_c0_g6~~TRINITY_DN915_c0_g6_i1.p1  ORF type:complete len:518 (-),score=112.98 TRINITY_DN915_c0_g6_i1:194-1747(-)
MAETEEALIELEDDDDQDLEAEDPKEIERKNLLARRKSSHLLQKLEGEEEDDMWNEEKLSSIDTSNVPPWLLAKVATPRRSSFTEGQTQSPQKDIREVRQEIRLSKSGNKVDPAYGLGGITRSMIMKTVAPRIVTNDPTITRLDLCWRVLDKKEMKLLLSALLKNSTLTEVDLAGNDLKKSGGAAIGKILKTNKSIVRMVLRSCELGKDGVKGFCSALAINTTLRSLDLGWNGIGASGMEHLEKALSKNKTLVSLDIQSNDIKRKGADSIAKLITNNRTLTHLDISNNDLTNPGAKEVFLALKKNENLLYLNVSYNDKGLPIAKAGIKAISELLSKNRERKGLPDAKEIIMHTPGAAFSKPMTLRTQSEIILTSTPIVASPNRLSASTNPKLNDMAAPNPTNPSSSSSSNSTPPATPTHSEKPEESPAKNPLAASAPPPRLQRTDSKLGLQRAGGGSALVLTTNQRASMSDFHISFKEVATIFGKTTKEAPLVAEKKPAKAEPVTWAPLAKLQDGKK